MPECTERLSRLRQRMREHGLTYYVVPTSDEHLNEYVPAWGQRRAFVSGFTGSAGDLLVGLDEALLFADGRYHLQAERELEGSGIALVRMGGPDQPTLGEYLQQLARSRADVVVGGDPAVTSVAQWNHWQEQLGRELMPVRPHLVDLDWPRRARPPCSPLIEVPLCWTGASFADKLGRIREEMQKAEAAALVVCKLDQLAWLLNLRSGDDVAFNPVFEAFAWIDRRSVQVFIREPKRRVRDRGIEGVTWREYEEFDAFLHEVTLDGSVWCDAGTTSAAIDAILRARGARLIDRDHPIDARKSVKNETERESMARANLEASAAIVRSLSWLRLEVDAGRVVTETSFRAHLEARFAECDGYFSLSFATIAAAGANGAIVHYKDAGETPLGSGEMFLIDCGIHASGGTTDATRTVSVGEPTAEQSAVYTAVLLAHIAAARQVFPKGTPGVSIDALCRAPLWQQLKNYDHGTGHGVGCFLNVHEGPFGIAEHRRRAQALRGLEAGMVTSIEPGYYREGWGGVRLENLYLIVDAGKDERGREFLRFEPLTFVPFDRRLIDRGVMTSSDLQWLDAYESRTRVELSKRLSAAELDGILRAL